MGRLTLDTGGGGGGGILWLDRVRARALLDIKAPKVLSVLSVPLVFAGVGVALLARGAGNFR
jgi:hypothetical protein